MSAVRRPVVPLLLLPLAACAGDAGEEAPMDRHQRAAVVDLSGRPEPRPEDVRSPEAAVRALYESISGPAERERGRDWDRLRSLFLPDARLVLVRWEGPDGGEEDVLRAWDVEAFIAAARGFYRDDAFYEREVHGRTERFGHIAHVLSTYESGVGSEESEPVARGINSIQLVRGEGRWWIAHLAWDVERPGNPVPERYLPREDR